MLQIFELFLLTLLILQDFTQSIRLVEVRIPNYVIKGSSAQLECLYDLDGEVLYSVKWYKDGNEFYRYLPRDMPPAQIFKLPGVLVDIHNSSDATVTLREVNLQSAGRFRCEVSGEAPSFQTVTEHGDMVVVSLPDQGPPKISGGRPRYQIGDWVNINCTAGRSKPAVQLSWFVNGDAAEPRMLKKYETIISGREALETSTLGLQFRVEQHHFRNGDMKLKCVASLSTFYWRSNEESVEGDRPQKAPVLESRETVYASNSRADPVQGMSMRDSFVSKILSFFIQPNAANKTDTTLCIKPITLALLIAMALITSTGCLEHVYMKNLWAIKTQPKSSSREYKTKAKKKKQENLKFKMQHTRVVGVNGNEERNNDTELREGEEQQLERTANRNEMDFNKETSTSRLPIILETRNTAAATTTTTTNALLEMTKQMRIVVTTAAAISSTTTIYVLQLTTCETSVSSEINTKSSIYLSSSCCCCCCCGSCCSCYCCLTSTASHNENSVATR